MQLGFSPLVRLWEAEASLLVVHAQGQLAKCPHQWHHYILACGMSQWFRLRRGWLTCRTCMRLEDGWYDHAISSEAKRGVAGSLPRERLGVGCGEEAQGSRWAKRGKEDRSMKNVLVRKPKDRVILAQLYIIGHTVRAPAAAGEEGRRAQAHR